MVSVGWQVGVLTEWGLFGLIYSGVDINRRKQFSPEQ